VYALVDAPPNAHYSAVVEAGTAGQGPSRMTRIEVPNTGRRPSAQQRILRTLALLVLLVTVACALWTWLTLSWAYSDGDRAGVLQKFARKGWLCKTYEGEIALYYGGGQYLGPGTSPQLWDFSVRDPAIAAQLARAVGHRVQLHYTEHPGIPSSCFAETRFFVDRVTDEQTGAAPSTGAPPPVPAGRGTGAGAPTS
jgi:hypothetical protein